MASICLLTDGSAHFASPSFRGFEHIHIIKPDIIFEKRSYAEGRGIEAADFPSRASQAGGPRLRVPDLADICARIESLSGNYDTLIAVLSSSPINPLYDVIEKAVISSCGKIKGQVINSQAISTGLGYLLEIAAGAIIDGLNPAMIERSIRRSIPHVYSTLCTPGWSYLAQSGFVDHAQAGIGEMLSLSPIFTLEEGGFSPIQKVKNDHSIIESFQGFLDEFDDLEKISFVSPNQMQRQEADLLHDHARDFFGRAEFAETSINVFNAVLFGPHTSELTVIEKTAP